MEHYISGDGNVGKPVKNVLPDVKGPRIMILGSSPSKDEQWYGKPFGGSTGYFLSDALSKLGLRKSHCALANVVQYPINFKPSSWDLPEVQDGIAQLCKDIDTWKPDIIFCLGNEALHLMTVGNECLSKDYPNKIHKWRGSVFESILHPGLKCLASYHPANILRDFSEQAYFRFDVEKLIKESQTKDIISPSRDIEILRTKQQVKKFQQHLAQHISDPLAIDIEGSQSNITAISFAWSASKAYVIPFAHNNGDSYWSEEDELFCWEVVKDIIENPNYPKIAQNGTYDFYALAYGLGICVQNYAHDTILGWWELYPELKKGLDVQASILTNEPYYKPDKLEGGLKFNDDEHFWRYNGIDSAVTWECWDAQLNRMTPAQQKHYRFNMELQAGPVLYMMLRGLKWSHTRAATRQEEARAESYRLQYQIDKESGIEWPADTATLLSELKDLTIQHLCSKRIKKKTTFEETRYVQKQWNGKRWVRFSGGKMLDEAAGAALVADNKAFVEGGKEDKDLICLCPQKKQTTKQIDYEPTSINDCEEFILQSKRNIWKRVKKCVAEIRSGHSGEALLGELGKLLSVSVNVGSTSADGDAQTFLYETCQLPCIYENDRGQLSVEFPADYKKRTEKGIQPSHGKKIVSSQGALAKLYAKTRDERVLWVLQLRRLRKVVSDLNVKLDEDDRLRSSISLVKETGRMAESKSPSGTGLNRQALNKEHRWICVADDNCELYQYDLEGADNWTVAAECKKRNDSTMFDDLSIGLKPAQVLALMIHIGPEVNDWPRQDIKKKWKELKDSLPDWLYPAGKAGTHGSSYGLGWRTMIDGVLKNSMKHLPTKLTDSNPLVLTKQQVEDIQKVFFLRYPGVLKWQRDIEQLVMTQGYIETSVGHTRRFMGRKTEIKGNKKVVNHETWREALASLPQFYTTYATKRALHNVYYSPANKTESGRLLIEPLLCVHDSLLTQGHKENRSFAKTLMAKAFDNPVTIADSQITIPAEGTVDTDWLMKEEVII